MTAPKVGILMGSKSDSGLMSEAAKILEEFEVPYEMKVRSAHRTPEETTTDDSAKPKPTLPKGFEEKQDEPKEETKSKSSRGTLPKGF